MSSRPAWSLLGWGSRPAWHTFTPPLLTSDRTTAEPALPVAPATTTVGRTSPTERAEAVDMPRSWMAAAMGRVFMPTQACTRLADERDAPRSFHGEADT